MAAMKLIFAMDGTNHTATPSRDWSEIVMTNTRETTLGNIIWLGVRDADRGFPSILLPKMIAPFGESTDSHDRTTIDLSVTDEKIRVSLESLTERCKTLVAKSGIKDASTIAEAILPLCIKSSSGEYAPRIRIRMNGGEGIRYQGGLESDTIPRGSDVRAIVEVRNIWISKNDDGTSKCGIGLYLNSANVSRRMGKAPVQKNLMDFLDDDEEDFVDE